MKSTEYIEWDKLEQIPFCLCRIAEDEGGIADDL